jgi:hypothetical protein
MPPIPRLHHRAAARGDDTPDLGRGIRGAELGDRGALAGPESGLALLAEDLRDPNAGAALDDLVQVDERRPMARRKAPADGALAAPRQPDEDDVHGSIAPRPA